MAQRKEKKINPLAMFLQAIEFHIAFRVLHERVPGHPGREGAMDKPIAVINAFCSELLLKTLICIETGHVPRGHHLLTLFNDLSPKTRKRITERWDAYAIEYADRWPEIEARIGCPVARDLPTALRVGSKTFELVRYYYEGREDFQFYIGALPHMLVRVVFELKPDWAQTWDQAFSKRPDIDARD